LENFSWQSDQGYRVLIDSLQDAIFVVEEGMLVYVNQRMAVMLGYELSEIIGHPFIEFVAAEDQRLVLERYQARISGEAVPEQYDLRVRTAQGSVICCALNINLHESPQGHTVTIGSARDVTRQKAELSELQTSQLELKSIFDQLPDVFYRTNMQGIITMISPFCFDVIGYRQEEMLGTAMSSYYKSMEDRQKMVQAITDGGGKATQVEAELRHKNNSIIWISTNAFVRFDPQGQPLYIEGVARDISQRKLMENRLTELSRTDNMTGIFNRRYFLEKSEEVIEAMRRYHHPASMLMMDLDHFKKINDKYGHHAGDLVLIAFAEVCRHEIREPDLLGRLGGEEFGLMLPETSLQNAQTLAERIRHATAALEIHSEHHTIRVTVSIGLVEINSKDLSLNSVMHRADQAMYQAKERGRNLVVSTIESV